MIGSFVVPVDCSKLMPFNVLFEEAFPAELLSMVEWWLLRMGRNVPVADDCGRLVSDEDDWSVRVKLV